MLMNYKEKGDGVAFARKAQYEYDDTKYEADLKDGDIIKILNTGIVEEGKFGEQHNFKIETRNGEKKMSFNQATINVLIKELGEDSETWINKDVRVIIKKDTIAGKKVDIAYLVVGDWNLDEYGELCKPVVEGEESQETREKVKTIEYPESSDEEAPF